MYGFGDRSKVTNLVPEARQINTQISGALAVMPVAEARSALILNYLSLPSVSV
jgi:hypothetical protein